MDRRAHRHPVSVTGFGFVGMRIVTGVGVGETSVGIDVASSESDEGLVLSLGSSVQSDKRGAHILHARHRLQQHSGGQSPSTFSTSTVMSPAGSISPRNDIAQSDSVMECSRTISDTSDFYELTDFSTSEGLSMCIFSDLEEGSDMSLDGSPVGIHRRRSSITSYGFPCREHSPFQMVLFCVDCDEAICFRCKVTEHAEHKVTTLINAASERRTRLKMLQQTFKCKSTNLSNSLNDHTQYLESLVSNKQTMMGKLDEQRSHLHQLVDRWHSKLQMQVDTVCSEEMAKVNAQIDMLSAELYELHEDMEMLAHVLGHNQANDILVLSRDVLVEQNKKILNDEELTVSPLEELYFLFNHGKNLSYSDFGSFTANRQRRNSSIGTRLISSGKLSFSFDTRSGVQSQYSATGLSLERGGNLIVTDLGLDQVQVFRPNGQVVRMMNTLPMDEPSSAVAFGESTIVVACRNDVKFFNQNGNFERQLQQCVECPSSLHACSSGELIVTDRAHDGPFIHIFNADMTLKNTIIGGIRAPSFYQPWYVTSNQSGEIIISDKTEHNVKVFSARGILISEFGGQGAQPGHFFHPAGVCVDGLGHILVADSGNHRVQMFTTEGRFCAILLADTEHELLAPMDLVVDDRGKLLVLQENGVISTYTYIY